MSCSEQSGGFVALLVAAIIAGCLTHGTLSDTLNRQMDVPEVDARLPIFTLTGRDKNGRQTLDYGE